MHAQNIGAEQILIYEAKSFSLEMATNLKNQNFSFSIFCRSKYSESTVTTTGKKKSLWIWRFHDYVNFMKLDTHLKG